MFTQNLESVRKEITSGGINILLILFGVMLLFIAVPMGGNIFLYLICLIIIPITFLKVQNIGNKLSWVISLVSIIYAGFFYYLVFPDFNGNSLIVYVILGWTFYRYYRAKKIFFTETRV